MATDRDTTSAATVYLVCFSCEEGYEVESVWSSEEAAQAHIDAKGWTSHMEHGGVWINDEVVRDAD